jgi:hypothetical protein
MCMYAANRLLLIFHHSLLIPPSPFNNIFVDLKSFTKGLTTEASDEGRGVEPHGDHDESITSDLVKVQMRRAIARWEEAYAKNYFDKDIYDCVLKMLNEGDVPPIYHTLCRDPSKHLFLPNTFVSNEKVKSGSISLSSKPVKVGKFISRACTDESVWGGKEFSYLNAFFTKDGHSRVNVNDSLIGKIWKFDKEISYNVTKLVNKPADMVGHDVEVTRLPSEFPVDF